MQFMHASLFACIHAHMPEQMRLCRASANTCAHIYMCASINASINKCTHAHLTCSMDFDFSFVGADSVLQ